MQSGEPPPDNVELDPGGAELLLKTVSSATSDLRNSLDQDHVDDLLPHVSSGAQCHFNGKQLKICLGAVEYAGQATELFDVESCVLETGVIYGLVGPNGVGKSTLARLITSKTLPGFPESLATCYLDVAGAETAASSPLVPGALLQEAIEARCKGLRAQIVALEASLDDDLSSEQTEALAERLGELCEQEEDLGNSGAREIVEVLEELGFGAAGLLDTPVGELSSGWRYKARLAKALLAHADLLVLDEPSFLDAQSMRWLVERTQEVAKKGAMVCVISHKNELLESLADRILFFNANRKLESYNCGFEAFRAARSEEVTHAKREESKGEKKQANAAASLKHAEKRVAKGEANYKKVIGQGEDRRWIKGKCKEAKQKAARSMAAKVKQLKRDTARLDALAKTATGHRVQALHLPGSAWPASQQMVSLQDVGFEYRPEVPVLAGVSLAVYGGDRIAVVGANGQGKTTLLKLLHGDLEPTSGSLSRASGQRVAYFPQDALERLVAEHGSLSAAQLLQQRSSVPLADPDARNILGTYGLKGDLGMRPIRTLSAGQRTRLYLALEFSQNGAKPSLLLLDEVENLDAETSEALMSSLADFSGAVLCISHDPAHLTHLRPRQVWRVEKGHVSVSLTDHLVEENLSE